MLGLLQKLQLHSYSPTSEVLCLYGDSAYPHRVHLQHPFLTRDVLTENGQNFNRSMSQVRAAVEWVFGDIVNYFNSSTLRRTLKLVSVQLVNFMWYVHCLETVLHSCMGIPHQNSSSWFHLILMAFTVRKMGTYQQKTRLKS